jgi:hypothetical protein
MMTLVTSVIALLLGGLLNSELFTLSIVVGVFFVVLGLTLFEFEKNIERWLKQILKIVY